MNIGPLDKRCRIEYATVTQDSATGIDIKTWVPLAVVWCGVQDSLPSRSEAVKNGLAVAINQVRVRMRYRADITSDMRLMLMRPAATIYQIIAGPAELGNKDGVELIVEKYSS